jgi:hypothetical protein
MMGSEGPGRLLIYTYAEGFGRIGGTDLIKLTASMRQRFQLILQSPPIRYD